MRTRTLPRPPPRDQPRRSARRQMATSVVPEPRVSAARWAGSQDPPHQRQYLGRPADQPPSAKDPSRVITPDARTDHLRGVAPARKLDQFPLRERLRCAAGSDDFGDAGVLHALRPLQTSGGDRRGNVRPIRVEHGGCDGRVRIAMNHVAKLPTDVRAATPRPDLGNTGPDEISAGLGATGRRRLLDRFTGRNTG